MNKTVETLEKGEVLLTSIRKVNGGKFQVELAEVIDNPSAVINVASLLNEGDDRFTPSKPKARRAWQSGTPEGIKTLFGVDVTSLTFKNVEGKQIASVNKLNPTFQGEKICIELVDSLKPSYEGQAPKQAGKNYFMSNGKHIYSSSRIVIGTATHQIIKSTDRVAMEGAITPNVAFALNS